MAITSAQQTQLIELYVAILDRAPLSEGLNFWAQVLTDSGSLVYTANEMWNSAGAQADYPAFLTTEQIVEEVFQNVFGRAPQAEGLAFWTAEWNQFGPAQTMINMIDNMNNNTSTDPQFLEDKALFLNKVEFGKWVAFESGLTDPDKAKDASEMITSDPASIAAAQEFVSLDPSANYILTTGTDSVVAGNNDDFIFGTETTLNTSDTLDGGDGYDVLQLDINMPVGNAFIAAPEIDNIELITVTQGGSQTLEGYLDLSDSDFNDTITLETNENIELDWSFEDIQSVNNTSLRIIDTDYGWIGYGYDVNAYAGDDTADLTVAEVDCLEIDFYNTTNNQLWSDIDVIDLHSLPNGQVSETDFNYIYALNVGTSWTTLNIDGTADLTIEKALNNYVNGGNTITTVDASGLEADLNFDIEGQGAVSGVIGSLGALKIDQPPLTITGAQGNNDITVDGGEVSGDGRNGVNGLYTTFGGNDKLVIGDMVDYDGDYWDGYGCHEDEIESINSCPDDEWGDSTVVTGAGMDSVIISLHGEQDINTGAEGDYVEVWGNTQDILDSDPGESTIVTEDGADQVITRGDLAYYDIDLGSGNDTLDMASCGEACLAEGDVSINAGAGDDLMSVGVEGFHEIFGGEGADTLTIGDEECCDENIGELSINMDADRELVDVDYAGADSVTIYGNSYDEDGDDEIDVDIVLGGGDDVLAWYGATSSGVGSANIPLEDAFVLNTGAGNDEVILTGDHRLNATFGDDNDSLEMTAEHLESQDTINMGEGNDTIILHNGSGRDDCDFGEGCDSLEVVRLSETSHTSSVEMFDLRNGNIELHLTTGLFQTALTDEGLNHITVRTEESEYQELPTITYEGEDPDAVMALSEGMSREDWESVVEDWQAGLYVEAGPGFATFDLAQEDLMEYILTNGVTAIDFDDTNDDGLDDELVSLADFYDPGNIEDDGITDDDEDQVFFRVETCEQTVDVTEVDFSLVPNWQYTLLGGNIRDIMIANDDFISGNYNLRFDSDGSDAESVLDTLIVRGGADITDQDEEQISGLECIILQSDDLVPDLWEIELNEEFVSQTTGNADLDIIVDTNVLAGSKLYLTTDNIGSPTNGVRVFVNSNVTLYIDGVVATPGTYGDIEVINELLFTTNSDNLNGTSGDDVFIATSADQVDGIDHAEGNGHDMGDELHLHFGVFNEDESLDVQLDEPDISEIEIIRFLTPEATQKAVEADRTYLDIAMEGVDIDGVQSLYTGYGDDFLDDMESGIHYYTGAGNDTIELDYGNGEDYYIHGGAGNDSVDGSNGDDHIHLGGVESVTGDSGNDTIDFDLSGDGDASGNSGDTYIDGNSGSDRVDLDDNGTSGVAYIDNVEDVNGGSGADTMDIDADGSQSLSVNAGYGNDSADIDANGSASVYVEGESGNDTLDIYEYSNDLTVYGDDNGGAPDGADSIYVDGSSADDDADITSIYGEGGNDYIYFSNWDVDGTDEGDADSVSGGTGNDTILVYSEDDANVDGGANDDSISVYVNDNATVDGDSGNDVINVTLGNWTDGGSNGYITGGEGNDTINVFNDHGTEAATITGGSGDDDINLLVDDPSGTDTLVFGSITYNTDQSVDDDSQGFDTISGFNFEAGGPGNEDQLNFTAFYDDVGSNWGGPEGDSDVIYGDWDTLADADVAGDSENDDDVYVLAVENGFTLTADNIATIGNAGTKGGAQVEFSDNGGGVVLAAYDTNSDGNYDTVDVYFVQDVDQDIGQAWFVDKVATIESATEIGSIMSIEGNNFADF